MKSMFSFFFYLCGQSLIAHCVFVHIFNDMVQLAAGTIILLCFQPIDICLCHTINMTDRKHIPNILLEYRVFTRLIQIGISTRCQTSVDDSMHDH